MQDQDHDGRRKQDTSLSQTSPAAAAARLRVTGQLKSFFRPHRRLGGDMLRVGELRRRRCHRSFGRGGGGGGGGGRRRRRHRHQGAVVEEVDVADVDANVFDERLAGVAVDGARGRVIVAVAGGQLGVERGVEGDPARRHAHVDARSVLQSVRGVHHPREAARYRRTAPQEGDFLTYSTPIQSKFN